MPAIATEPTYYEVVWGIEESERTMRVDYGDGMAYSEHAEANATRVFLEFVRAGRKVGFFVNGKHVNGHDFAEEEAEWERQYAATAAPVEHKTTTGLWSYSAAMNWRKARMQHSASAWARCSCGWVKSWDNRALARKAARWHREQ